MFKIIQNEHQHVDVFFSAEKIPKIPNLRGTDSFIAVYIVNPIHSSEKLVGISEIAFNTSNPYWITPFAFPYHTGTNTEILVRLYHIENKAQKLENFNKHTFLGESKFFLENIAKQTVVENHVTSGRNLGSVKAHGELRSKNHDIFNASFACQDLVNKEGFFGTSDPFLEISRLNENGTWTRVWRNHKVDKSLKPTWPETKIPLTLLCNGDKDRPLAIQILDFNSNGDHKSMGNVFTSVSALVAAAGKGIDVIEKEKQEKNKNYKNSGLLFARNVFIERRPTFDEYIEGGCEINLMIGIDFTKFNGAPSSPKSLHHIDASGATLNPYEKAINDVGHALEPYDTDKLYPVYGFGASFKPVNQKAAAEQVYHNFPIYAGGYQVPGVEGILKAYRECINVVKLADPAFIAPIIKKVTEIVKKEPCTQEKQKYNILLIITSGHIEDLDAAKQAIIEASKYPLSVVFLGVGDGDFSSLDILDSDRSLLTFGEGVAQRDIVQFVSYNKAMKDGDRDKLAKEVLLEIPTQFLGYMYQHRILPNQKK